MAMSRALVTGGGGFIGSHVVEQLLAKGHSVVVIDNFSTGRRQNLAHVSANPRLRVVEADIADYVTIAPQFVGADWVFHIAGLADIVPSIQRPLEYHRTNVVGSLNVVEAARLAGVRRLVYAASSSCYGVPDTYPTPEMAPARPQYPYALTKYLGEQIVLHWAQVYKLPAVSLRLFNVFGPRSRTTGAYGAVFGVFLAQKLAQRPLTIVGDGTQTRDFTFVTDVANAFYLAATTNIAGEVFNIGSGQPQSVNRIAELLGGETAHIPKRPGEPECTWADRSKANRMLGWVPQVTFEEGVQQMVAKIEYWREAPVWDPAMIAEATKEWFAYLGGGAVTSCP